MAGHNGRPEADLNRRILEEGSQFEFFQLMYLLHRRRRDGVPVGERGPYSDEKVHLRPFPSLSFSAADVQRVETTDGGEPLQVLVNFMGLYGVAAPTPVYLTELVCFTDVDAGPLTDFLDIFNHRLTSLIWRAWLKYRFPYRYESGAGDRFSTLARSFVGFDDTRVCEHGGHLPATFLKYLGLMSLRTRPPVALELAVSDYFDGVSVRVLEWMKRWVPVPPEQRNRMGAANCSLGSDLTVGERVPDRGGKFRIAVGPLSFVDFRRFLPDTRRFAKLCAFARVWVHDRLDYDVQLAVRGAEVPPLALGGADARLGFTTWVTAGDQGIDHDPAIVFPALSPRRTPAKERS